jgi:repressor LexA
VPEQMFASPLSTQEQRPVMDIGKDLTKRQQEIFDFIKKYSAKYGYPPTVRDIGKAVGLASSSTVHAHLANLEKVGLLRRDPTKPRAIELLVGRAKRAVQASSVPVVGEVAAGEPVLAEENIEEYLELPSVIGGDEGDFILQVKGDSMKDAGIIDGDFVVVQQSSSARNGQIVVALLEDEATVKRFFREKDRVRLQPANKDYKPIRTRDAQVVGRVVGVFRRV